MKRTARIGVLATMLALLTLTTGCVKFKSVTTVMSDGSGKLEMTIGLSDQMLQMAEQQGEDPFCDLAPAQLEKDSKGFVAFTQTEPKKEGGYTYMVVTGYFEDINKIEMSGPDAEPGEEPPTYSFTRDGNAATLTAKNTFMLSMVKDYEPMPEDQKALVAGMLTGFSMSEQYVLPGASEAVKGVDMADNTATIELTTDNLLNNTGAVKELKGTTSLVMKIGEITEDDAALAAFKAELAEAVKAWEAAKKSAE